MNIPKGIILGKKWFSSFFLLMILNLFSFGLSQSCDQVATLPKDFSLLLPQYEKLKRIHLLNYFFLDDVKSDSAGDHKVTPNSLKISLSERSVFKLQMTPQHVGVEISVKLNGKSVVLEAAPGIPVDYTWFSPVESGQIELDFFVIALEDEESREELRKRTIHDKICNTPYMKLEIFIEENEHLQNRLKAIKKETSDLENLQSVNFNEMVNQLKLRSSKEEKNQHQHNGVKTELTRYKLNIPKAGLHASKGITFQFSLIGISRSLQRRFMITIQQDPLHT